MQTLNERFASRIKSAQIALWSVSDKMDPEDLKTAESEIKRANESTVNSTRHASVLTAEILIRRYGAQI